jgi:hypothetical protein
VTPKDEPEEQDNVSPLIVLSFPLPGPNKGKQFVLPITSQALWDAYAAIHKLGIEESKTLLFIAGRIAWHAREQKFPDPDLAIDSIWNGLGDPLSLGIDQWETEEDQLHSLLYWLLTNKTITRAQASGLASRWTGKQIDQEPFRKKLDRWVNLKGLPKIGQTIRKPRK